MAQCLSEVALAGTAGPDDEHCEALVEVAAGGELMHERTIQLRQALEVELLKRFAGAKGGTAKPQGELLLLAPGDFILDQKGEGLGVGEFGIERLAVTASSESRMPERRSCFRYGTSSREGDSWKWTPCG